MFFILCNMEKGLTKLWKLSVILRNQTLLPTSAITIQYISQHFSSVNKENTELREKEVEEHKLYDSRKELMNVSDFRHKNIYNMNKTDLINELSLWFKEKNKTQYKVDVSKNEQFALLCQQLMKYLRTLTLPEILNVAKVLITLDVQTESTIMQSVLQILRSYLNEMTITQLSFLLRLLHYCQSTPLSDTLRKAVPLIIKNYIYTKLDYKHLPSLATALWHLRRTKDTKTINTICDNILKQQNFLDIKSANIILESLWCLQQPANSMDELISILHQFFICNAFNLTPNLISKILWRTSLKVQQGDMRFFNETLVYEVTKAAIAFNIQTPLAYNVVRQLNRMRYVHIPFIKYLQKRTISTTTALCSFIWLLNFLDALSISDYKTDTINTIVSFIDSEEFRQNCPKPLLLKFAVNLISIDVFNSNIIRDVFTTESVFEYGIDKFGVFLNLYQSVKTLFPTYDGPWPTEDKLNYTYKEVPYNNTQFQLKEVLERALGGPQYIEHALRTKLYHFVDHVVVMRKGGYPIAINQLTNRNQITTKYIEDLDIPSDSEGIAILLFPQQAFSINTQRLINTWSLRVKSLKKLTGFRCIVINPLRYNSLAEYEKIPYLMRKITTPIVSV